MSRSLVLRVVASALGLWLSCALIVRLLVQSTDLTTPQLQPESRIYNFIKGAPVLARTEGDVAVAVGSSALELGLMAPRFDALLETRGLKVTTFNLGIPNSSTHIHRLALERLGRELDAGHQKVALSILEFQPGQATQAAVRKCTPPSDQLLASLEEPKALAAELTRTPDAALRRLMYRFIFGGVNPANLRYRWAESLYRDPEWLAGPRPPKTPRELTYGAMLEWNLETRGSLQELNEVTRPLYAQMLEYNRRPEMLQASLERSIARDDVLELHFSDALVDDFIAMCGVSRRFAARTLLVLSPERPWLEKQRSPAVLERRNSVLRRIEEACGSRFVDLGTQVHFDDDDFFDLVHVNLLTGSAKYTQAVADAAAR